jgi:hypothetical protein
VLSSPLTVLESDSQAPVRQLYTQLQHCSEAEWRLIGTVRHARGRLYMH